MPMLYGTVSSTDAPSDTPAPTTRRTRLLEEIRAVSGHDCTVLLCGESGSGKEYVARQIHGASRRAAGPFVAVDCTTLRDTLFESQLFGHVRGAFTGADHATLGLFRAADGGTLMLDEVGELPLGMQAKLLRCIQERAVVPVGGTEPIAADVRLIAATHRDLREMVRRGEFREDLYFRIHVVRLDLPPLRARSDEIIPLAEEFLQTRAAAHGAACKSLTHGAQRVLLRYEWPGNVRELQNAMEHALVFSTGCQIAENDLPGFVREGATGSGGPRCGGRL